MAPNKFQTFFRTATGNDPYDWQCRLAEDPNCQSRLIDIPTGLGKTAGVVLAWLWNRCDGTATWPRRLVYCLPMRTLVEQTENEVQRWLKALAEKSRSDHLSLSEQATKDLLWLIGDGTENHPAHSPIILMGGEDLNPAKKDWDLHPERPAILIGTQDMLLSRALNRGYGMSRYRWPMHFGLLNNDALWVMDEVQLMGVGIETSAQLQGLREKLGLLRSSHSWWMSATLNREQLGTVDFADIASSDLNSLSLKADERKNPHVSKRIAASKTLEQASISPASGKAADLKEYADSLADFVVERHRQGTLTLVVLNRVNRAQDLTASLRKKKLDTPIALIHARFRPEDRREQEKLLHTSGDRIIVATQAVEAGVDVSAATMITEIAPWSSLIQRFGRCNRYGELTEGGRICWIDLKPEDEKDQRLLPYRLPELKAAAALLRRCPSASPEQLAQIDHKESPIVRPVIRRKDLLELFDTTPDISGNDLDISRYIRDTDAADVQVYWRTFDSATEMPPADFASPLRNELCRVPYAAFIAFAKKQGAFCWDPLEGRWEKIFQGFAPGRTYLLPLSAGGYRSDLGWTGIAKDQLHEQEIVSQEQREPAAYERDRNSFTGKWVSLRDHHQHVETTVSELETSFSFEPFLRESLKTAARWHDVGKAHSNFQDLLRAAGNPPKENELWAKSEGKGKSLNSCRRGFRHELASALAWLQEGKLDVNGDKTHADLVAFLIATHHGRIRLSLRSMPTETGPSSDPDRLFARGIWDRDELPELELPDGKILGPLELDLSCIQLGDSTRGPSWLARMTRLRDDPEFGPFRIALLETILRAADARASR